MQSSRIEVLQRMPIFGGLHDDALEWLFEGTNTVRRSAGTYFFRQNDPADVMYVLETGRVSVFRSWEQRELLLRGLGPGDCFGEMALIDLFPRSASVRAEEDCEAMMLSPADLHRLFERDVEQFAMVQMNIGRELSRRLRETDELLFRAMMGDLPVRPAPLFGST